MWTYDVAGGGPTEPEPKPTPRECHSDIIFVLDRSLKTFNDDPDLIRDSLSIISTLVSEVDIASGGTRVGLVTYSNQVDSVV